MFAVAVLWQCAWCQTRLPFSSSSSVTRSTPETRSAVNMTTLQHSDHTRMANAPAALQARNCKPREEHQ